MTVFFYYILEYVKVFVRTLWLSAFIALAVGVLMAIVITALDIFLFRRSDWKDADKRPKSLKELGSLLIVTDRIVLAVLLVSVLFVGGYRVFTVVPEEVASIPSPTRPPSPTPTWPATAVFTAEPSAIATPTPLPTNTPTITPVPLPTDTPTATFTPGPPPTETFTPVPTAPPTATFTPVPQTSLSSPSSSAPAPQSSSPAPSAPDAASSVASSPNPAPVPASSAQESLCNKSVAGDGVFLNLWKKYQNKLGCPREERQLQADSVYFVEQWFEYGHLFFLSSDLENKVIAAYGTPLGGEAGTGAWQSFPSEPWPGLDHNFCFDGQGLDKPIFDNFNEVWCFETGVKDKLGLPVDFDSSTRARVYWADNSKHIMLQHFDKGFILRDSDGATNGMAYIFLNNGTYIRDYY